MHGQQNIKICFVLFITCCYSFIHSFHWHVPNATIPCRSQELLPFLSVMYFFLPPFYTDYSSILSHFILPSISWYTYQFLVPKFIYNTLLENQFSTRVLYMNLGTTRLRGRPRTLLLLSLIKIGEQK